MNRALDGASSHQFSDSLGEGFTPGYEGHDVFGSPNFVTEIRDIFAGEKPLEQIYYDLDDPNSPYVAIDRARLLEAQRLYAEQERREERAAYWEASLHTPEGLSRTRRALEWGGLAVFAVTSLTFSAQVAQGEAVSDAAIGLGEPHTYADAAVDTYNKLGSFVAAANRAMQPED